MTWISWRNFALTATVTASREVASLPPAKIQSPVVAERYRAADLSVGDTRTILRFEWAVEPGRPEIACFIRPRRRAADETLENGTPPSFAATDLVRHKLSRISADAFEIYNSNGGVDMASDIAPGFGYHTHFIPPDGASPLQLFAGFEFDALSRDTPPHNFVDWGHAWYGRIDFEPQIDFAAPASFAFDESAVRQVSWDNSAMRIRRKRPRRRWRLVFRSIKVASEQSRLEDFLEYAGDGGRFLVGLNRTDLARGVMLAVLDQAAWSRTSRRFGQLELPLIEAI